MIKKEIEQSGQISNEFINRTLDLYKPEHMYLSSAYWDAKVLHGLFRPANYPYTKPGHIDYITASLFPLFISQASYVNSRLHIIKQYYPNAVRIKEEVFFEARDKGYLLITSLDIKFKKKIKIKEGDISFVHKFLKHRVTKTAIFSKFICNFAENSCIAKGLLLMPLQPSMVSLSLCLKN